MKIAGIWTGMALAGLLLLAGAHDASAQPQPQRPTVGVIDIVKVFDSVDDKKKGDAQIEALGNELKRQRDAISKELEDLQKQLNPNEVKADSPEGRKIMDDAMKKGLELQDFSDYMREKLLLEERLQTAALYKRINDAVATYAKANGMILVLSADNDPMNDAHTPQELQMRITMKKVIYAAESLDITRDIIQAMNANSHAGGH